jgi:hypothetical protein
LLAAAVVALVAGAASAQTVSADQLAVAQAGPALKLARADGDFAAPYVSPAKEQGPNLGHTALERRLNEDSLTGAVGYLCGIDRFEPDSYQHGGGPDTSVGHKGTFLGASLGYAFK